MTLTIDINDSVADKILYFLEHFKDDVKIVDKELLDIEVVYSDDKEYQRIIRARQERKEYPQNYVSEDAIDWDEDVSN